LRRYKKENKLIISLKHLPYTESLKQLMLPMLKYRQLRGDMIEVCKIVHDFYDLEAAVKPNFNTFSTTRPNKNKLQKSTGYHYITKYSFSSSLINCGIVCQIIEAGTINTLKSSLDKYCESYIKMCAKRTTWTSQNTLDWIGM